MVYLNYALGSFGLCVYAILTAVSPAYLESLFCGGMEAVMKKKITDIYFSKSNKFVILMIVTAVMIVGGWALFKFVPLSGQIGLFVIVGGIVMFFVALSQRVTDREYDKFVKAPIDRALQLAPYMPGNISEMFEYDILDTDLQKIGKDKGVHSGILCCTRISTEHEKIYIKLIRSYAQRINQEYKIDPEENALCLDMREISAEIERRSSKVIEGFTRPYLTIRNEEGVICSFPVEERDFGAESIVEEINRHKR